MLQAAFNLYKFLSPAVSETELLDNFASWHNIKDRRTMGKYLGGQQRLKQKSGNFNDSSEYLLNNLNFLDFEQLWECLKFKCGKCNFGADNLQSCLPGKGCILCEKCNHKNICERRQGTGKVPEDCIILGEFLYYVNEIEKLPYIYFPLKYVLPLKEGLAFEILEDYTKLLTMYLGEKFDLEYISCILRYVHMYVRVPFLTISRLYKEEVLNRLLMQITSDPIDDTQFELWERCRKFEKELLRIQKLPKNEGSVDELLERSKDDISVADMKLFTECFYNISEIPLRPIDVRILQKCLCWKDCSLDGFLHKLKSLSE